MSATLLTVEQNDGHDAGVPWVMEGGRRIEGQDDVRRIAELRRGLERHERVRIVRADADDEAVDGMLRTLHHPTYLASLRSIEPGEPTVRPDLAPPGMSPDMPVAADAVSAAFEGVRTAVTAAQHTLAGARLVYALSRPPGHHAGPDWLAGYCYLNTTAAAARTICDGGAGRVGILDIDFHYPNGTSAIVAAEEAIELHSIHAWPVTNVPERTVVPRSARERVFEFCEPPTAEAYLGAVASSLDQLTASVDALVVSIGYDTVRGDPHGCWALSPTIFESIGAMLSGTDLPVCVIQEGGYARGLLAACSDAFAGGVLSNGSHGR